MLLKQYRRSVILFLLIAFFVPAVFAEKLASIIIDDLGYNLEYGYLAIALPDPITLAFLPHTVFAAELANKAHNSGKEIMLHLPLQSVRHHSLTPGTLKLHMTYNEFIRQLESDIESIPHIKGINNHMGSLLTQHPGYMDWLMSELAAEGGLYFVDSRTTTKSVASLFAEIHKVPHLDRDIFLDPDFRPETIRREFTRFINKANQNGHAIAIAHPHPHTIQFIKEHINELEEQGIKLVPVSEMIARKHIREETRNVESTGTASPGL
jgi:polysaccharide deacetylase 2 family uncharacterized protein YibQ